MVINAAPVRSKVVDEAVDAVKERGGDVSPVIVRQRVAFQHCLIDGRTAGEFEPGGAAATEIAELLIALIAGKLANKQTKKLPAAKVGVA